MKKIFGLGIGLMSFVLMSGCAKPHIQTGEQAPTSDKKWLQQISNAGAMKHNSEFAITYPQENGPAVHILTVTAHEVAKTASIVAKTESGRRPLRAAALTATQYKELLEILKNIKFEEFADEDISRCDIYILKIRIGASQTTFQGCRRVSHNATVVSKLAHKTEYFLLAKPGVQTGN